MSSHQQATDELGGNDLGGAGEEGLGEGWMGGDEGRDIGALVGVAWAGGFLKLGKHRLIGVESKNSGSRGKVLGRKPTAITTQQVCRSPADHISKEKQAAALIDQGHLREAEAIYRELIASGTDNHVVYGNLAAVCGRQGKFEELIGLLKKTLELRPNYPEAHHNLGVVLEGQGDLDAAIACYQKAIELKPNYPDAHYNLGNAQQQQGKLTAAIACYTKTLELKPDHPEAHNNLGISHEEQGDPATAIDCYRKALELNPNFPEAHNNLGSILQEQGDLSAAIASYKRALELKPNYAKAYNNLGTALQDLGDLEAAIDSYKKALELDPNNFDTYNNLGNALHEQGNLSAAHAAYKKALGINPNHREACWNSSLTMLLGGDYKNGWERYEWRSKMNKKPTQPHAEPKCPRWDGSAPNPSAPLLVVSEQGLGDTLQFMRYCIALRNRGIQVSLCAQSKLHTLIKESGIDPSPLTPEQANQISEGQWIPLLSVPRHLEVSPGNPIITNPYIRTADGLISKWHNILAREKRPIIAINWQGNPEPEKTNSQGRSLPLETFAPITQLSNASLLSLQKGYGSEQMETCSFKERFVQCQPQVDKTWDFLETAAIIDNCSLVITSDTSVAHLASGMGKVTWLLLKKVPEWRWGLDGDTSFWYPTMRLFRQRQRGNWDEVLQRVAAALQQEFPEITTSKHASRPAMEA